MKTALKICLITTMLFAFGCREKDLTNNTMPIEPQKGDTIATITTSLGEIGILLYTEQVPETTKNFIELSKQDKYDNTIFHRVIKNFMIQGGDFENGNGTGGYTYLGLGTKLNDEIADDLQHIRGAVSMAKTAAPNSAGSQFFVVQAADGTHHLDGVHTVFGYVYEGMDVVDKIAAVETAGADRPLTDVVVEKVEISEY